MSDRSLQRAVFLIDLLIVCLIIALVWVRVHGDALDADELAHPRLGVNAAGATFLLDWQATNARHAFEGQLTYAILVFALLPADVLLIGLSIKACLRGRAWLHRASLALALLVAVLLLLTGLATLLPSGGMIG